jgi:undecaprenyl pyrophosphate phosphatase UppP
MPAILTTILLQLKTAKEKIKSKVKFFIVVELYKEVVFSFMTLQRLLMFLEKKMTLILG